MHDVVIAGAGTVGSVLGLMLAQAGVRVGLIERRALSVDSSHIQDYRTVALAARSVKILQGIGLWQELEPKACPILDIRVVDQYSPLLLDFHSQELNKGAFGWIVENRDFSSLLHQQLQQHPNITIYAGVSIKKFQQNNGLVSIALDDGVLLNSGLLVGADGRHSQTREMLGLRLFRHDYQRKGITTVIRHEYPHEHTALEHFFSHGPFAILPMKDDEQGRHRSSIVWTETTNKANALIQMEETEFLAALARLCLNMDSPQKNISYLGKLELAAPIQAWPLVLGLTTAMGVGRVVLAGDAAHAIHPIAGQGLNMGMRDIEALSTLIIENKKSGFLAGDNQLLQRYQANRLADNWRMGVVTHGLEKLFAHPHPIIKIGRRMGLAAINQNSIIRRFFMHEAMGIRHSAG